MCISTYSIYKRTTYLSIMNKCSTWAYNVTSSYSHDRRRLVKTMIGSKDYCIVTKERAKINLVALRHATGCHTSF